MRSRLLKLYCKLKAPLFVRKVRKAYGDWDKYTLQSLPAMLNCDLQRAKSIHLNGLYQQAKFHLSFPFFSSNTANLYLKMSCKR